MSGLYKSNLNILNSQQLERLCLCYLEHNDSEFQSTYMLLTNEQISNSLEVQTKAVIVLNHLSPSLSPVPVSIRSILILSFLVCLFLICIYYFPLLAYKSISNCSLWDLVFWGPGFKSQARDEPDRFFVILLCPSRQIPGQYLEVGHDHFFPSPSQFIIH